MSSCLDDRTRKLIFSSRAGDFSLRDMLEAYSKSLDEFIQTPLLDLAEINERLDTIGVLVANAELRDNLTKAVDALCRDYKTSLFKVLEDMYGEHARLFGTFQQTRDLRNFIVSVAESTQKLPPKLDAAADSTRTIDNLVNGYNGIMSETGDTSVRAFFDYVNSLAAQIKAIEEKKPKNQGWAKKQITYEELNTLIDRKKFERFRHVLGTIGGWHKSVYIYTELAKMAVEGKYTRPDMIPREENCLVIKNGTWGAFSREGIIPNDTDLSSGVAGEVLEGVNNGGKTFDMKKALYLAALAQAGCWVPAEYVRTSIRDKIILREKGTGSSISALQQDCNNVSEANPRQGEYWLIGMDETFTSTERKGGEALNYGLIKYVTESGRSLIIVSSHYINLSRAFSGDRYVVFNHFPFTTIDDKRGQPKVEFPHKKNSGPMQDYRYGIAVATNMNFDPLVLQYANERLKQRVK